MQKTVWGLCALLLAAAPARSKTVTFEMASFDDAVPFFSFDAAARLSRAVEARGRILADERDYERWSTYILWNPANEDQPDYDDYAKFVWLWTLGADGDYADLVVPGILEYANACTLWLLSTDDDAARANHVRACLTGLRDLFAELDAQILAYQQCNAWQVDAYKRWLAREKLSTYLHPPSFSDDPVVMDRFERAYPHYVSPCPGIPWHDVPATLGLPCGEEEIWEEGCFPKDDKEVDPSDLIFHEPLRAEAHAALERVLLIPEMDAAEALAALNAVPLP